MLRPRLSPGTCEGGKQWYVCKANGFTGCCSVDACDFDDCPDSVSSSSSAVAGSTKTATSTILVLASSAAPSSTSSATTSDTTSTTLSRNVGIATNVPTVATTSSLSPSVTTVTQSATATSAPVKGSSKTPIIAGIVSGVVAVGLLVALAVFCIHRSKQKKERKQNIKQFGVPTKDFVLDRAQNSDQARDLEPQMQAVGVFSPFGGRYQTPPPLDPGRQAIRDSLSEMTGTVIEDRPLPDIEKSNAHTAPPLSAHPAYHLVPHCSPEPEIYQHHPGTHIPVPTPYQSPIEYQPPQPLNLKTSRPYTPPMPSPPMTMHPAYHASQLGKHPAFQSRSSPPKNKRSPPREKTMLEGGSTTMSNGPSLPPGHVELQGGDVPVEFLSPIEVQNPQFPPSSGGSGDFQNFSRKNTTTSNDNSGPIGLGLADKNYTSDLQRLPSQSQSYNGYTPSTSTSNFRRLVHPSLRKQEKWPNTAELPGSSQSPNTNGDTDKEVISPLSPECERWSGSGMTGQETQTDNTSCCSSPDTVSPAFGYQSRFPGTRNSRDVKVTIVTGRGDGGRWDDGYGKCDFVGMKQGEGEGKGKERALVQTPEERMLEAKTPLTAGSEGCGAEAGVSTWGSWVDR